MIDKKIIRTSPQTIQTQFQGDGKLTDFVDADFEKAAGLFAASNLSWAINESQPSFQLSIN